MPPSTPDLALVLRIAEAARAADGQPPFSDQSLVDLRTGARQALLIGDAAAAIVSPTEAELVVAPADRRHGHGTALLERIIAEATGELRIWAHGDHPAARALAASHRLESMRELLQLRMPVPVVAPIASDHFQPGRDEDAWLALNAKAFAFHPEQGSVSRADLDELMSEDWFLSDDFLLIRDGARMIGYCWLKVEVAGPHQRSGEFYVVGVDPDRQRQGLGRRLMDAGFARLAERGIRTASLYVEADNVAAVTLYRSLGFVDHSVDIQYALTR
ncbi:mycothiol synthase [Glaciihabitans sp. UYNi722]|uniref:mycothiol synthase n=1 Tax=Glaciihabitans sp. UYNi722 TaxID=3156344 RepID=UPI0033968454